MSNCLLNKSTLITLLSILSLSALAQTKAPKREFRGAWIQCVNGQFQGIGTQTMQKTLSYQLDELQKDGANAIIFQVRPECDALYESKLEPWSKFLTGEQGRAPQPYWDPLQWMIDECHKRGMELHAWINPSRAKTKNTTILANNHIAVTHPERVFAYDGLFILNPGIPENRDYICDVVSDIVSRYDVDGLHIDDYFYPYPVAGVPIPDEREFHQYNNGFVNINDWRRYNVDMFIKQLGETVHKVKPWVKFGVSPFGIYRNAKSDPQNGSRTNGLQNYDDLYADVLKWVKEGWVDYNIPQLYWEIGHKAADYETLVKWWSAHAGQRPVIIGQDVLRTVKATDPENPASHQMPRKYMLQRTLPGIYGSCQWYAAAVCENPGNYQTMLREVYHNTPALQPRMPWIDGKAPGKPRKTAVVWTQDGPVLFWTQPKAKTAMDEAVQYVVYRFNKGEKVNLEDPSHILCITRDTNLPLSYQGGDKSYVYVVTALDRIQNESKGVKKKIKL